MQSSHLGKSEYGYYSEKRGHGCDNSSAYGLINAGVYYFVEVLSSMSLGVFSDPVKDNNRIVERVSDDGEKAGDCGEVDLFPQDGKNAQGYHHIVNQGYYGSDTEPKLEAEPYIAQDQYQSEYDGFDR